MKIKESYIWSLNAYQFKLYMFLKYKDSNIKVNDNKDIKAVASFLRIPSDLILEGLVELENDRLIKIYADCIVVEEIEVISSINGMLAWAHTYIQGSIPMKIKESYIWSLKAYQFKLYMFLKYKDSNIKVNDNKDIKAVASFLRIPSDLILEGLVELENDGLIKIYADCIVVEEIEVI
jgi:hypothetical protein